MSYISNIGFREPSTDAFQRLRTSNPFTIIDLKQLLDSLPLFFDDQEVSGTGTASTFNIDEASTTLSVSASTAGKRVRQSKLRGSYRPLKSLQAALTFVFRQNGPGITKRVGYFDEKNGLFIQRQDEVTSVVVRTYTSGAAVDTVYNQADWNSDTMDGMGPSGITVDWTKSQIFAMDFEWLGVGRIRFFLDIDGQFYKIHEVMNANILDKVYMTNPNLPIRYEIENDGTGNASELDCICAAIVSEGGNEDIAQSVYVSRAGVPQTLANQDLYTPVISVRLESGAEVVKVNPILVDIMATSTTNYEWRLFLNPTIAGTDAASWVSLANSGLEYDVSRDTTNTVSGGYVLAGGYGSSTNQVRSSITTQVKSYLTIGTLIDGSSDEMVLAVANIEGNGGTVYGGILMGEYT